ncbi:type II inositol 1,4,5-trisphosphate 5-phosphatase-like isoform X1 [Branchiostoma floridae]|uniref:phosphoinositide 5-phosphatase n=1 Tax=Branchiostoma floridae TaxID=7739 RepID=A0A9J7N1H6_BRAFL|nr:type II inositol 1,4,5-trisphosphate 5-phosphatase-like isoform X1 [Branchiostoma floridae]
MDPSGPVQQLLSQGEKCVSAADAYLVQGRARVSRVAALVETETAFGPNFGFFMFGTKRMPVQGSDLTLVTVIPVKEDFAVEVIDDPSQDLLGSDVPVKVCGSGQVLTLNLPFGSKSGNFLTALRRAISIYTSQPPAEVFQPFAWLEKYELMTATADRSDWPWSGTGLDAMAAEIVTEGFEDNFADSLSFDDAASLASQQDLGDSEADGSGLEPVNVSRGGSASTMGSMMANPPSVREPIVKMYMLKEEAKYTHLKTFRIFAGTWNVNGQPATESLKAWLAKDSTPPDLYAVGFQELDLSKEAFVFNDSAREEEWVKAVTHGLHPEASYRRVRLIRLVGMMLLVFVRSEHNKFLSQIEAQTVGTGIMGKMGNKGGVAIRFDFHNTSFCIVNSHLAAHTEHYERRNQDYSDICARMQFNLTQPPLTIHKHNVVLWVGDLNYRLSDIEISEVKALIEKEMFWALMEHDQLKRQMNERSVFKDFKEASVNFIPTYKYDPGTDDWDTSEKCRVPAWCDRVLCKGDSVSAVEYRSHRELKLSDHKPVSCLFDIGVKVIDEDNYKRVFEEVIRKLDKLENEFLPSVSLSCVDLKFERIKFLEPQKKTISITNTGQVPCQFEFICKLDEKEYCKPWLNVQPSLGFIMPGDSYPIELEIYVDKNTAGRLNSGEDSLEDILVLHLDGGKDYFVTVQGDFIPSCFGSSIEALCNMRGPIREVPVARLVDLEAGSPSETSPEDSFSTLPIPKEIWLLVDHLYKHALCQEDLFQQPGLHSEIEEIRDCLDTGMPDTIPGQPHSVAECLLMFLDSLPEPVVPHQYYQSCLDSCTRFELCEQLMSQVPEHHRNVFKYLTAFLRELLKYQDDNKRDPKMLAMIFGGLLLKPKPDEAKRQNNQQTARRRATFIYQFQVNPYDG